MNKFTEFLRNMRQFDPILIEAVEKGFDMIYEATEDVVEDVKEKVGDTPEEDTPEEDVGELLGTDLPESPEELDNDFTEEDLRITSWIVD